MCLTAMDPLVSEKLKGNIASQLFLDTMPNKWDCNGEFKKGDPNSSPPIVRTAPPVVLPPVGPRLARGGGECRSAHRGTQDEQGLRQGAAGVLFWVSHFL